MTISKTTNKNAMEMIPNKDTVSPTDSDFKSFRNIKIHRVGSITFGIIMIILGTLLLLKLIIPAITYTTILNFWPVTLILLGLEILIANTRSEHVTFQYDGWSIFYLFMIIGFTICIGVMDFVLTHFSQQLML